MQYWLMKSEPGTFSIDDLAKEHKTQWTGVRNFTARNNMMQMRAGDLVLFYHSSCPENGVYGLGKVTTTAQADPSQFDTKSQYYDKRATEESPLWFCVEIGFVEKFPYPFLLEDIKKDPTLAGMVLVQRSRLSVQPVSANDFEYISERTKRGNVMVPRML